ncbi:MAG: leucine-rich repeat domain-containing protein [Treponema sp.]|uniref:leucine-rich repeat domain-containing protein n=1 Tax=Treponema sp. TaxID=166 RepID=UPI0025D4578C|nr:leucine-rich repeat domain-containing protein [Treponema sp.]MBQ6058146.1 leucine-rich repeat domain-containing protein [Treponema sp.]MBQ9623102.1 leucine-rich repeat domain-containing protein [Treponema sp.]MBR0497139.1 leucine-rich repeat domain-containing protein [Treponema sp.]
MKRKLLSALAAVTALVFASCSMGNTFEKQDTGTDGKTAYITVGMDSASRTALPTVTGADEFTSFTLTGQQIRSNAITVPQTFGTWTTDSTSSAYAKMTTQKFAVYADTTYTFTLTAVKGGATWQGSTTKTIEAGVNSLSFTLSLAALSTEGKGAINVTLTVPDAVKAVEAWLYQTDEETCFSEDDENPSLTFADGKATYARSDIAAGNYVLVYTLYGDEEKTLKLGQWREYAGITDGVTSTSSPVIASNEDLAHIYKITLNLNGGTFTGTFPGSYTRHNFDEYDAIDLPWDGIRSDGVVLNDDGEVEIYKKNCFFDGWYDAETDGEAVDCIESEMMGDITLWAYWTDTLTIERIDLIYKQGIDKLKDKLNLQALLEKGFDQINLKLTNMADGITPNSSGYDDWKDPRFTAILEAICDAQGLSVNLDLSETNITFIPSCAFYHDNPTTYNPVNLTGIILPKTLTKIIQFAFESTSFKKITIPASVIAIGRNAFENSGLEEITFEKNSALDNIGQNAFHNSNLKSITLPESLQDIQDNAFDACSKLDTINYEGTAEDWTYVNRGDDWHNGIKATTVKCSDYTVPLDLSPADFEGLIGTKPASIAKEVGDIVFSDGSATPYSEDLELTQSQKDNAVAVIFYVGTGLNSENDNSTKRTLGVGFNTASDYNWCSEEANACELSIDTIKCEPDDCYPSYRRFYFKDKTANDKNGSDNLKQIGEFLTANGKENDTDDSSKYPAFYFAKNYNAPGNQYDDGWYLPSLAEFFELYDIRFIDDEGDDINVVFKFVTGKDSVFDYQNGFWTSTQASGDEDNTAYAFVEYYAGIYSSATSKFDYFNVCAIREF